MNLEARRRAGRRLRKQFPMYSYCGHCGCTWNVVESHSTYIKNGHGCFPLCQRCWQTLSIEERIPYYTQLWIEWEDEPVNFTLEDMISAVREGR